MITNLFYTLEQADDLVDHIDPPTISTSMGYVIKSISTNGHNHSDRIIANKENNINVGQFYWKQRFKVEDYSTLYLQPALKEEIRYKEKSNSNYEIIAFQKTSSEPQLDYLQIRIITCDTCPKINPEIECECDFFEQADFEKYAPYPDGSLDKRFLLVSGSTDDNMVVEAHRNLKNGLIYYSNCVLNDNIKVHPALIHFQRSSKEETFSDVLITIPMSRNSEHNNTVTDEVFNHFKISEKVRDSEYFKISHLNYVKEAEETNRLIERLISEENIASRFVVDHKVRSSPIQRKKRKSGDKKQTLFTPHDFGFLSKQIERSCDNEKIAAKTESKSKMGKKLSKLIDQAKPLFEKVKEKKDEIEKLKRSKPENNTVTTESMNDELSTQSNHVTPVINKRRDPRLNRQKATPVPQTAPACITVRKNDYCKDGIAKVFPF